MGRTISWRGGYASRRAVAILSAVIAAAIMISGCKIKPIEEVQSGPGAGTSGFDASQFVTENWASKVLPYVEAEANPIVDVVAAIRADIDAAGGQYGHRAGSEGAAWNFIVKGAGRITSKDTASRAGKLTVTLDDAAPPIEITLQIGPVIRGNAIRDSLPFINFKEFTNQLEFADVGKALTARALDEIEQELAVIEPGTAIAFTGAMTLNKGSDPVVVSPVLLMRPEGNTQ